MQRAIDGILRCLIWRRDIDLIQNSGFVRIRRRASRVQREGKTSIDAVVQHLLDLRGIVRGETAQVDFESSAVKTLAIKSLVPRFASRPAEAVNDAEKSTPFVL